MSVMLDLLLIFQISMLMHRMNCKIIGPPQFESDWLLLTAQSTSSSLDVQHGLRTVPGMVEVLVKAIDGPNEGFIFKALEHPYLRYCSRTPKVAFFDNVSYTTVCKPGNAERDGDSGDMYGGVIYFYDDVRVRVMAPSGNNDNKAGAVIYTGEAPYWRGVNSQTSMSAKVQVRCWSETRLPEPCFHVEDLYMLAGSSDVEDTYIELNHNLTEYPSVVKVRAKLADGDDIGWYSDAQGASSFNYNTMGQLSMTGGLKFAYNNISVRVWTSSYPTPEGVLFSRIDGWGDNKITNFARSGYVEISAWCHLKHRYERRIPFGPSVTNEDLQVRVSTEYTSFKGLFSVMVEADDGPNKGYLFEGVGSAMPNTYDLGQPCPYGGLIYAYNHSALRIWRPDHDTGAAICIPYNMGFGTNSQASQNGTVLFRIFQSHYLNPATDVKKQCPLVCSHFQMLGNDTAYNDTAIDTQYNVTTLLECDSSCRRHYTCVTYSYNKDTCQMFNTTNDSLFYTEINSQVWGLKDRRDCALVDP